MDGEIVVKDIIRANFDQSVEDFCKHVVLAMGNEAEDLILPVAPRALGVPLVVCMVHSDKHVQLQQLRYHPSAEAQPVGEEESVNAVYVLFRPGHYDLLYSRRQTVLPMKSVDDYLASSSSMREPARPTASSSSDTGHLGYLRQSPFRRALEMMLSSKLCAFFCTSSHVVPVLIALLPCVMNSGTEGTAPGSLQPAARCPNLA